MEIRAIKQDKRGYKMTRIVLMLAFAAVFLWSLVQAQVVSQPTSRRRLLKGYCRPTIYMFLKGQRTAVAVGEIVRPNMCVECRCTSSGSFQCCLSKKNAGKTIVYPGGLLCTKCTCAELPFPTNVLQPDSLLENHCFRGNNLMTCVTNICIHPLAADPNCIQAASTPDECCDRCIRSGCFVMINDTRMATENNQLALDDHHREDVELIKMNFGESIQTGCQRGTCVAPDFMVRGGFVIDNSTCLEE